MQVQILYRRNDYRRAEVNRDHVMREAEKHCALSAGWMFNQPGIIAFWEAAFAAGAEAERLVCAKMVEPVDESLADEIRARGKK